MNISFNTDYAGSTGETASRLAELAEAGFTHVFWCHQWCTDFIYTASEVAEIDRNLKSNGLTLLDIHGSAGIEKCWFATEEYRRLAGVELVRNRLEMLNALGGEGVVMMHAPSLRFSHPSFPEEDTRNKCDAARMQFDPVRRSLDALLPVAEKYHTKIAIENMQRDDWTMMEELFAEYPPELLGLCYDSGHANILENYMNKLEANKDRLIATHLNDNDGSGDQHKPPFYGTVDWGKLAEIVAASSYSGPPSFELSLRTTPFFAPEYEMSAQPPENRKRFLADAYERCIRFAKMVEAARGC